MKKWEEHGQSMLNVLKRMTKGMGYKPDCNCQICDAIRVVCAVEGKPTPPRQINDFDIHCRFRLTNG